MMLTQYRHAGLSVDRFPESSCSCVRPQYNQAMLSRVLITVCLAACLQVAPAQAKRRCRKRDRLVPLKYTHGGQVFLPRRISCGGTAPVIILLHGNNPRLDRHPSLGGGRKLEKRISAYIRKRFIWPVVLAEPVHHGTCQKKGKRGGLPVVFGGRFSFRIYRKKLARLLRRHGIRVRSWSVVAHSGAGCCPGAGIFALAKVFPRLYLYGTSDTCYSSPFYATFPAKRFARTRTRVVNICRGHPSYPGYRRYERLLLGRRPRRFRCDGTYYKRCVKHPSKRWYAYVTKRATVRSHTQVLTEFMKTILFKFFRRRVRR